MQLQKYFQAILASLLLADVARRTDAANLRGSEPLGTGVARNEQLPSVDSVFAREILPIEQDSAEKIISVARQMQEACEIEFNVIYLYDNSNTQSSVKIATRNAVIESVRRLFADAAAKGRKVRVTIVSFANQAAVVQTPSDNVDQVVQNINAHLLDDVGIGTQMEKGLDAVIGLLSQIDLSHKTSLMFVTDGIVDDMNAVNTRLNTLDSLGVRNRVALGVQGLSGLNEPNLLRLASIAEQFIKFPNADKFQELAASVTTTLFDCLISTLAPVVPPSSTAVPSSAPSNRPTGKPDEDPPEELVNLLNLLWLIALLPHEQKVKKKRRADAAIGEAEDTEPTASNPVALQEATAATVTREPHQAVAPTGTAWKPKENKNIGGLAVNMQPVANLPLPKKKQPGEARNEGEHLGGLHNWIPQQPEVRRHGEESGAGEPGTNPPSPRSASTISEEPEEEYEVIRTHLIPGLIGRTLRGLGYEEGPIARAVSRLQYSGERTTPEIICAIPMACAAYIQRCRANPNTTPEPNPSAMMFSSNPAAAAPLPTAPATGASSRTIPRPPGL